MAFDARAEKGSVYSAGATALLLAIASIGVALGFEHIGGYVPCMLCYMERWAYYVAIPLLFLALVLAAAGARGWAVALFVLVALAFLANAVVGVYHAGAEWKFWPGPASCGGENALATSAGSLLKDLEGIRIVRCDEASLRFLGLSFAGWNAVASLMLALLATRAAFATSAAHQA